MASVERVFALSSSINVVEVIERTARNACLIGIEDVQVVIEKGCEVYPR
ncbi:MAG: hypothetical protein KME32_09890 [Mojavia pulchra JT2-VF2]|uniref:Uncharacterized protein n=1 Tax=Mojavia pulchra JT2-VF2 TaxID=287848 RepID=A0A951PYN0_9NOST|nr:hypothetical protein [Mojavia pulchra JT2-VF2]